MYDKDPGLTYLLDNRDAVFASARGALDHYVPDDVAEEVMELMQSRIIEKFIYLHYTDNRGVKHTIDILRIELDSHSRIHRVFSKVLDSIDDAKQTDLAIEVLDLFVDPDRLITPPRP
jgi:hypothetical protein